MKKTIVYLLAFILLFSNIRPFISDSSVSINVPPKESYYTFSISSNGINPTAQNTNITYTINYGTTLSLALPLKIVASWSQGTIDGDATPSVDVVDYVVGSSGNAYNSTSAVVDTNSRTITWDISSFPAGTTGQSVTFKLKTNSNYTGDKKVSFDTSLYLSTTGLTTSTKTKTDYYLYDSSLNPTPTPKPTSTPTPSPTSSATPTPTPTPLPSALTINSVDIRSVSASSAGIAITTSAPTNVQISYGASPLELNSKTSFSPLNSLSVITLNGLSPLTDYFFKVLAKNASQTVNSAEIFTFKTASSSNTPQVIPQSFIAVSQNTIISKPSNNQDLIILPVFQSFDFKFNFKNQTPVKKIIALIRQKNVLAVNTFDATALASSQVEIAELEPGVFSGKLKTPLIPGKYEIYARVFDVNGNISEVKIADLTVIGRFTVLSKISGDPIEGARVLIYLLNPKTNKYDVLPPTAMSVLNPSFTDSKGELSITLPQAKYKALVSEIGYKDQMVGFSIDPESQGFPKVYMEKQAVGIGQVIRYTSRSLNDVLIKNTAIYVTSLTGSIRFFNLISELSLAILVIMAFFAFMTRTHIPLSKMHEYIIFYIRKLRGINISQRYTSGFIKDSGGNPIDNGHVYLVNLQTEEIIAKTNTNNSGHFLFNKALPSLGIIVMKAGYKTSHLSKVNKIDGEEFILSLEEIKSEKDKLLSIPLKLFKGVLALSFEFLLFISIIFELLFLNSFGLIKTAPFIAVSLFNLFIWIVYLRIKHHSLS